MAPKLHESKQAAVVEHGTRMMEIICELENYTGLEVVAVEIIHHPDGAHRALVLQVVNPIGSVQ